MPHADFVHLRVHSAYSLSEGAIKIDELVALCRTHAMPAVAVTDTTNLFGAMEFSLACAEAGVQPIIGCQLAIRRDPHPGLKYGASAKGADARNGPRLSPDVLVVLVQSEQGYRNLVKLVSRAFLESAASEAPQLALADLEPYSEGLIALTGGPAGAVGRLLAEGRRRVAEEMLERLAGLFPGRLYVELMRHGLEAESQIEPALVELAYGRELPLVATNEAFFADADMFEAHDALLCIAEGRFLAETDRRRLTPDYRFKSAAEMRALFADLPEAVDNTLVVAQRCAYMLEPREPILPAFPMESGRDEATELRLQAKQGLEARLAAQIFTSDMDETARERAAKPYRERLDYELDVVIKMGLPGYFLIVADIVQWAKAQAIPVGPGRGSGAGSVVAWALTITDLDPLRFGLLFERFLNPERVSMPDFDIDFCQDLRDKVIAYVQDRYGRDRVAQIITFGKLQARAVLRDVGRVLEMPYGQVDRICKLVPYNPAHPVGLQQAIDGEPMLQQMRRTEETVARLINIALKLEGLYRHASTHAAGVVIGDRPLDELVPLYRDPRSDMPVTQFNMKYVEQAGLVKFDFLGLKTLTVLARAQVLLERRDVNIDLTTLPLDDRATYEMLGRGETTGVFQLESSGMRDVLKKLRPDRFEDIIALVALYRPGPMDNIPRYIACRHGEEEPDYLHPSLEGILKETSGVMIYQEQVMQIAQVLSGFSLAAADLLRRAMGKKIKAEMAAQRQAFIDGAVARDVSETTASRIFDQVYKFAGYGFNKSHAAAYALVAYQTAYFKANHPVEFFAALMTLDLGNTDKLYLFRQELGHLGVELLPPDINKSEATFTVEAAGGEGGGGAGDGEAASAGGAEGAEDTGDGEAASAEGAEGAGDGETASAIRYALSAIKNVGRQAMEALVQEREANGPYKSLADFAGRLDHRVINKRQLESLACAGAFDSLNSNRRQVFEAVETLVRHASVASSERESAQHSLFGATPETSSPVLSLPETEDWAVMERLRHEFEAIGFYLSAHPLGTYDRALARLGVIRYADLVASPPRREAGPVKLAGTVIGKRERTSARGNRYAFVQLSDMSGVYEVTVFSEVLAAAGGLLDAGAPLLITAEARIEEDNIRLTAEDIQPLDKAVARAAGGLRVFIQDEAPLTGLRGVVGREGRGRGRITLVVPVAGDREVEVMLPGTYAISPATLGAIKAIRGIVDVQEI
ncbi:MAG: DNA polymerase III subunit alpha [Proteobacteria bacterium]|nr:DNA polymerase III subunit alpha [Pseudomonadota bacterium]